MWSLVACQRAVPNDVLLGPSNSELQNDASPSVSIDGVTSTESVARLSPTVAISSTGISEEQDFEVVANSQTIESDAERIAANHAKYIVENSLQAGTRVSIRRSGDVIPIIHEIHHSKTKTHQLPESYLPSQVPYEWDETHTQIRVPLKERHLHKDILQKQWLRFFQTLECELMFASSNGKKKRIRGLIYPQKQ